VVLSMSCLNSLIAYKMMRLRRRLGRIDKFTVSYFCEEYAHTSKSGSRCGVALNKYLT